MSKLLDGTTTPEAAEFVRELLRSRPSVATELRDIGVPVLVEDAAEYGPEVDGGIVASWRWVFGSPTDAPLACVLAVVVDGQIVGLQPEGSAFPASNTPGGDHLQAALDRALLDNTGPDDGNQWHRRLGRVWDAGRDVLADEGWAIVTEAGVSLHVPHRNKFPIGLDLRQWLRGQRDWSRETFGPGDRHLGTLDHIRRELEEIARAPRDLSEWVDVAILAFDGALRAGHSPADVVQALADKAVRNRSRTWPDWRTAPRDRAIEHVRAVPPPVHDLPPAGGVSAGMEIIRRTAERKGRDLTPQAVTISGRPPLATATDLHASQVARVRADLESAPGGGGFASFEHMEASLLAAAKILDERDDRSAAAAPEGAPEAAAGRSNCWTCLHASPGAVFCREPEDLQDVLEWIQRTHSHVVGQPVCPVDATGCPGWVAKVTP